MELEVAKDHYPNSTDSTNGHKTVGASSNDCQETKRVEVNRAELSDAQATTPSGCQGVTLTEHQETPSTQCHEKQPFFCQEAELIDYSKAIPSQYPEIRSEKCHLSTPCKYQKTAPIEGQKNSSMGRHEACARPSTPIYVNSETPSTDNFTSLATVNNCENDQFRNTNLQHLHGATFKDGKIEMLRSDNDEEPRDETFMCKSSTSLMEDGLSNTFSSAYLLTSRDEDRPNPDNVGNTCQVTHALDSGVSDLSSTTHISSGKSHKICMDVLSFENQLKPCGANLILQEGQQVCTNADPSIDDELSHFSADHVSDDFAYIYDTKKAVVLSTQNNGEYATTKHFEREIDQAKNPLSTASFVGLLDPSYTISAVYAEPLVQDTKRKRETEASTKIDDEISEIQGDLPVDQKSNSSLLWEQESLPVRHTVFSFSQDSVFTLGKPEDCGDLLDEQNSVCGTTLDEVTFASEIWDNSDRETFHGAAPETQRCTGSIESDVNAPLCVALSHKPRVCTNINTISNMSLPPDNGPGHNVYKHLQQQPHGIFACSLNEPALVCSPNSSYMSPRTQTRYTDTGTRLKRDPLTLWKRLVDKNIESITIGQDSHTSHRDAHCSDRGVLNCKSNKWYFECRSMVSCDKVEIVGPDLSKQSGKVLTDAEMLSFTCLGTRSNLPRVRGLHDCINCECSTRETRFAQIEDNSLEKITFERRSNCSLYTTAPAGVEKDRTDPCENSYDNPKASDLALLQHQSSTFPHRSLTDYNPSSASYEDIRDIDTSTLETSFGDTQLTLTLDAQETVTNSPMNTPKRVVIEDVYKMIYPVEQIVSKTLTAVCEHLTETTEPCSSLVNHAPQNDALLKDFNTGETLLDHSNFEIDGNLPTSREHEIKREQDELSSRTSHGLKIDSNTAPPSIICSDATGEIAEALTDNASDCTVGTKDGMDVNRKDDLARAEIGAVTTLKGSQHNATKKKDFPIKQCSPSQVTGDEAQEISDADVDDLERICLDSIGRYRDEPNNLTPSSKSNVTISLMETSNQHLNHSTIKKLTNDPNTPWQRLVDTSLESIITQGYNDSSTTKERHTWPRGTAPEAAAQPSYKAIWINKDEPAPLLHQSKLSSEISFDMSENLFHPTESDEGNWSENLSQLSIEYSAAPGLPQDIFYLPKRLEQADTNHSTKSKADLSPASANTQSFSPDEFNVKSEGAPEHESQEHIYLDIGPTPIGSLFVVDQCDEKPSNMKEELSSLLAKVSLYGQDRSHQLHSRPHSNGDKIDKSPEFETHLPMSSTLSEEIYRTSSPFTLDLYEVPGNEKNCEAPSMVTTVGFDCTQKTDTESIDSAGMPNMSATLQGAELVCDANLEVCIRKTDDDATLNMIPGHEINHSGHRVDKKLVVTSASSSPSAMANSEFVAKIDATLKSIRKGQSYPQIEIVMDSTYEVTEDATPRDKDVINNLMERHNECPEAAHPLSAARDENLFMVSPKLPQSILVPRDNLDSHVTDTFQQEHIELKGIPESCGFLAVQSSEPDDTFQHTYTFPNSVDVKMRDRLDRSTRLEPHVPNGQERAVDQEFHQALCTSLTCQEDKTNVVDSEHFVDYSSENLQVYDGKTAKLHEYPEITQGALFEGKTAKPPFKQNEHLHVTEIGPRVLENQTAKFIDKSDSDAIPTQLIPRSGESSVTGNLRLRFKQDDKSMKNFSEISETNKKTRVPNATTLSPFPESQLRRITSNQTNINLDNTVCSLVNVTETSLATNLVTILPPRAPIKNPPKPQFEIEPQRVQHIQHTNIYSSPRHKGHNSRGLIERGLTILTAAIKGLFRFTSPGSPYPVDQESQRLCPVGLRVPAALKSLRDRDSLDVYVVESEDSVGGRVRTNASRLITKRHRRGRAKTKHGSSGKKRRTSEKCRHLRRPEMDLEHVKGPAQITDQEKKSNRPGTARRLAFVPSETIDIQTRLAATTSGKVTCGDIEVAPWRDQRSATLTVDASITPNNLTLSDFFRSSQIPISKSSGFSKPKPQTMMELVQTREHCYTSNQRCPKPGISLSELFEKMCEEDSMNPQQSPIASADEALEEEEENDGSACMTPSSFLQYSLECLLETVLKRGKVQQAVIADFSGEIIAKTENWEVLNADILAIDRGLTSTYFGMAKLHIFGEIFTCVRPAQDWPSYTGSSQRRVFASIRGSRVLVIGLAPASLPGSCIREVSELAVALTKRGL